MFVEVDSSEMVVDVKYAILYQHDELHYRTGTLKAHLSNIGYQFHYLKSHYYFKNIGMYSKLHSMNDFVSYYVFVSQKEKIQQAMEQRALNKILKRIVNDDFIW